MKRILLLKTMLLLCALVVGSGSVWAQTVLFHETFGDNSGSARPWANSYSVKTGVYSVYSNAMYSITNAKQSKNTMGKTASALVSNQGETGVFIIGPLNVSQYSSMTVTNYFGMTASSWNATNSVMKLSYSTDNNTYTEVTRTGSNPSKAVSKNSNLVQASYTLPSAASSNTLYLKFEFKCYQLNKNNTDIGQAYFDEVEIKYTGSSIPSGPADGTVGVPVCELSIDACTYESNKWKNNNNNDYALDGGSNPIPSKEYGDYTRIRLNHTNSYTITVPSEVTITKIAIKGESTNLTTGTQITVDGVEKTFTNLATDVFDISSPSAGTSISFYVASKEFGLESITLYTADGITLETTAEMEGWRTFYDASQDYAVDANTKIYVVKAKSTKDNVVELTALDATKVKAGTPVILKTSATDHKLVLTKTTEAADLGDNLLAYAASTAVDGYRMGYKSTDGIGFYKYTATAPASGVVYIDNSNVVSSAHEFLAFSFDNETTGIANLNVDVNDNFDANAPMYNLAGQRVNKNYKGVIIQNGRKYLNK